MIKLKDILLEEEKPLSKEKKTFKSGKLFIMKSPYSNENVPYDHIGFITDDGEIIDMSGHRYTDDGKEPLPPQKYKYKDTEDLFKLPKNKEEAIKKGYYKEIPLPKSVDIPSETPTCSLSKKSAENCGSYVKIVLSNNGIKTTESNNMIDIATKVGEQSTAGKEAIKTLDRKGRKKEEPKKEKPAKEKKSGGWWQKASKTRKANYIKKFGGPPNESIIKLKDILLEGMGDCYQAAGRLLMKYMGKGKLVHGMVNGQGSLEGKRFGHAWVEVGGKVLDHSNGQKRSLPKKVYYALGRIKPSQCKYYNGTEATKWMVKSEHWGPWEMSGDVVMAEEIPDAKGEIGKKKIKISKDILNKLDD